MSARERATIMHDAMDIFRAHLDEAARLLTLEHGKPLNDSLKECSYSADVIDFYAEEGRRIDGTHFAGDLGPTHSFVLKQPHWRRGRDHALEFPGRSAVVEIRTGAGGGLHLRDQAAERSAAGRDVIRASRSSRRASRPAC